MTDRRLQYKAAADTAGVNAHCEDLTERKSSTLVYRHRVLYAIT